MVELVRQVSPDEESEVWETTSMPRRSDLAILAGSPLLAGIPLPFELVVPKWKSSDRSPLARTHSQTGSLPVASLVSVGVAESDGEALRVYVVVPELCFVQMGCVVQRAELTELAFELCGDYALLPDGVGGTRLVERPHVTTSERLRSYVAQADGVHGVKRARMAAECVVDGSRSPRESQIALEMILSHRLGGYGLPMPRLNERIPLEGSARRAAGVREIVPDFYWPEAGVVLEYDSDAFHVEAERREHDIRKLNAYEMMGLRVLSLTRRQFSDQLQFACVMEELGNMLRCEKHGLTANQQRKRAQLHGFLSNGRRHARS